MRVSLSFWKPLTSLFLTGILFAFITADCTAKRSDNLERSGKVVIAPVLSEVVVIRNAATEGIGNSITSQEPSFEYETSVVRETETKKGNNRFYIFPNPLIRIELAHVISIHAP